MDHVVYTTQNQSTKVSLTFVNDNGSISDGVIEGIFVHPMEQC